MSYSFQPQISQVLTEEMISTEGIEAVQTIPNPSSIGYAACY